MIPVLSLKLRRKLHKFAQKQSTAMPKKTMKLSKKSKPWNLALEQHGPLAKHKWQPNASLMAAQDTLV